ncbi:MAG: pyruvate kinase [Candidatus Fermentibacteria bacterium]|nr:pyruvate kinase [Candidatus Fermentibacteria bacterium]
MKRTKIVASISDLNCSEDFIRSLFESGMNVVRINSAHQSFDGALKIVKSVRSVSSRIALMMDTKGPEIRTGAFAEPFVVQAGEMVEMSGNCRPDTSTSTSTSTYTSTSTSTSISVCIPVTHSAFARDVPLGSTVLIDDGEIELLAIEVDGDSLLCRVIHGGLIKGRKGVNIPNVHIGLPSLSSRDLKYIDFAVENDFDFIAHSFVRSRDDVEAVQEVLDKLESSIKVIAKIENHNGVQNIDEILEIAYGVMVARGDLAIEIPFEKVPGIQKMLINKCIERRKPVIIATQMLHSMIENPRPTRAEVNDVAGAIYDQADAIMLSGETAVGAFPVEAVKTMAAIAGEVEKNKEDINDIPIVVINNDISAFLIKSAVEGAVELNAEAVIADTTSGRTIRSLSAYRGKCPILAQCYSQETVRHLALSYGVSARFMEPEHITHEFIGKALGLLKEDNLLQLTDMVVIVGGNFGRSKGVSFVEIGSVENLISAEKK